MEGCVASKLSQSRVKHWGRHRDCRLRVREGSRMTAGEASGRDSRDGRRTHVLELQGPPSILSNQVTV